MKKLVSIVPISLLLVSCGGSAVNFSTGTLFGLEAQVSADKAHSVKFGYQRAEGVRMPTKIWNEQTQQTKLRPKAYSVLSLFDLKAGSFSLTNFGNTKTKQVFATGKAALETNSGEAVGNTMLNLKGIDKIGALEPEVADKREAIVNLLDNDEFSGPTLQAIIDIMGLDQGAGIGEAERALDTATEDQLKEIYDRAKK